MDNPAFLANLENSRCSFCFSICFFSCIILSRNFLNFTSCFRFKDSMRIFVSVFIVNFVLVREHIKNTPDFTVIALIAYFVYNHSLKILASLKMQKECWIFRFVGWKPEGSIFWNFLLTGFFMVFGLIEFEFVSWVWGLGLVGTDGRAGLERRERRETKEGMSWRMEEWGDEERAELLNLIVELSAWFCI